MTMKLAQVGQIKRKAQVEQTLNACPPHGSIIRKECLMVVIHIIDLIALV